MLLLCTIYILAGFVGREPWREVDMTAFGYMQAMAQGESSWLQPQLDWHGAQRPRLAAILAGCLGAAVATSRHACRLGNAPALHTSACSHTAVHMRVRCLTWHAAPVHSPVAFAFGGEASPTDYARALADGGLLALLACLGLAQLSRPKTQPYACATERCQRHLFCSGLHVASNPKLSAVAALLGTLALTFGRSTDLWRPFWGAGATAMALCIQTP